MATDLFSKHTGVERKLRLVIAYLFLPLSLMLFYISMKGQRFKSLRRGRCMFWGTRDYLVLCDKALKELQNMDLRLLNKITFGRRLHFYMSHKRSEQAIFIGLFSINQGFCDWDVFGVIARVVYVHFVTEAIGCFVFLKEDSMLKHQLHDQAKQQTRTWLAQHGFPPELVETYDGNQ